MQFLNHGCSSLLSQVEARRCRNMSHVCNQPINYLGSIEQQCIPDQLKYCGSLPVKLMMEASPAPMMIRHTSSVQKLLAKPQPTDDTIKIAIPQPASPSKAFQLSKQKRLRLLASSMTSQVLYRAAQVFQLYSLIFLWCTVENCRTGKSIYMQHLAWCSLACEK